MGGASTRGRIPIGYCISTCNLSIAEMKEIKKFPID
jgi:hypothetical protein